jgi:hypothetical protein
VLLSECRCDRPSAFDRVIKNDLHGNYRPIRILEVVQPD